MKYTKADYVVACPFQVSVGEYMQVVISLNTWAMPVCGLCV